MKKTFRRVLYSVLAILIPFLLFSGWMSYRFHSEIKVMTPLATGKVEDDLFAVRDAFVNCFFVKEGDSLVAFDAGNDADAVVGQMKLLGFVPEQVVAVFLTHTDGDHIAAIPRFTRSRVYISSEEEQMINGKTRRSFVFFNRLNSSYTVLEDNQIVMIGKTKVKGILTPGHTPGSMSYLVDDRNLFTGDTLSLTNGSAARFNEFFNMNSGLQDQSIMRLANVEGIRLVLTAHYGISDDPARVFRSWR